MLLLALLRPQQCPSTVCLPFLPTPPAIFSLSSSISLLGSSSAASFPGFPFSRAVNEASAVAANARRRDPLLTSCSVKGTGALGDRLARARLGRRGERANKETELRKRGSTSRRRNRSERPEMRRKRKVAEEKRTDDAKETTRTAEIEWERRSDGAKGGRRSKVDGY